MSRGDALFMKTKLSEERKAQKRENYHKRKEQYKKYRDARKLIKSEYDKKRREEKKEIILQKNKDYYQRIKNTEKYKNRIKEYNKNNRDKINEYNRIMSKNRKDKIASKTAKKRASKKQATPTWLTKEHHEEIQEFYTLSKELSWLFEGEVLHVDHIIPLCSDIVCGLHVPWNLQLLPAKLNLKKSNKLL